MQQVFPARRLSLFKLLLDRRSRVSRLLLVTGLAALSTSAYAWLAGPTLGSLYRMWADNTVPAVTLPLLGVTVGPLGIVGFFALALASVGMLRSALGCARVILQAGIEQDVAQALRLQTCDQILRLDLAGLQRERRGAFGARVAGDVVQVQAGLAGLLASARQVMTIGALTVVAAVADLWLAAAGVLTLVIAMAVLVPRLRRLRACFAEMWRTQAELGAEAVQNATLLPIIRAYGAEAQARATFRTAAERVQALALGAARMQASNAPYVEFVATVGFTSVLLLAGLRFRAGTLSPEMFVSSLVAVGLMFRPLTGLARSLEAMQAGQAALSRLDTWPQSVDADATLPAATASTAPGGLALRGVGVRFSSSHPSDELRPNDTAGHKDEPSHKDEHWALRSIDLDIASGEVLAVAGPNGAGKTTLLRLLAGLLPATEGVVSERCPRTQAQPPSCTLRPSSTLRPRDLRDAVAWMPQEPDLLATTVVANIALGDAHPDPDRVRAAAQMAGAEDFIHDLVQGYDTRINEGGLNLSLGQRQRLCLARALYREAPILVLDEPTAALDDDAEANFVNRLKQAAAGRTVVIATHRERLLNAADRVVLLRAGRIEHERSNAKAFETRASGARRATA